MTYGVQGDPATRLVFRLCLCETKSSGWSRMQQRMMCRETLQWSCIVLSWNKAAVRLVCMNERMVCREILQQGFGSRYETKLIVQVLAPSERRGFFCINSWLTTP